MCATVAAARADRCYEAAIQRARRESVWGFAAVTLVTLAILGGGVLLAEWLGGN